MVVLAVSAAVVGFLHSLAPGHWLPVVLTAKARKWPRQTALMGAAVAASGHIVVSNLLGLFVVLAGAHFLVNFEEDIERYGSILLIVFGLIYAATSFFRHSHCHGHGHHGPHPTQAQKKAPFAFLFSLGLSPCVAALPVFIASAGKGTVAVFSSMVAFSLGVLSALLGATLLVSFGTHRLDHPWFEHHGDVITGLSVTGMGVLLFFLKG